MGIYLCRWPNGDCSVVWAPTKKAAIIKLDEAGDADGCPITSLRECQVHFRLTDDGQLVMERLGEEMEAALWDFCFPVLNGVVPDEAPKRWSAQQRKAVRQAVRQERARVHAEEVAQPETALGRDIKKHGDGGGAHAPRGRGDAQEAHATSQAALTERPPSDWPF